MIFLQRFLYLLLGLLFLGSVSVSSVMAAGAGPGKPAKTAPPPAAAVASKSALIGLDAAQVTVLLGPSSFKRSENGAHVWQYIRGGCVLNLFLFKKPPEPSLRVQYLDAAPQSQNPGDPVSPVERQRCLRVFTAQVAPPAAK